MCYNNISVFFTLQFFVRALTATFDTFKDNNSKVYSPMKNSMKLGVAAIAGAATLAGAIAPANAYAQAPVEPTPVTNIVSHAPVTSYATATQWSYAPSTTYQTAGAADTSSFYAPQTTATWSNASIDLSAQSTVSTPTATVDADANAIVQTALQGLGGSYVWGGKTFGAWDCSGFVSWVYAQNGINLTAYTYAMKNELTPTSNPQPGDIVFTNGYSHAGIYLGNGQMISALNPSQGTIITSVDGGGYMPVDGYYTI